MQLRLLFDCCGQGLTYVRDGEDNVWFSTKSVLREYKPKCFMSLSSIFCSGAMYFMQISWMNFVISHPSCLGLLTLCQVYVAVLPKGVTSSWCRHWGVAVPHGDKGWHQLNAARVKRLLFSGWLDIKCEAYTPQNISFLSLNVIFM